MQVTESSAFFQGVSAEVSPFFKRVPVRWNSSLFSLHCPNESYTLCLMTNCEKLCPGQKSIVKDMSKEEIPLF